MKKEEFITALVTYNKYGHLRLSYEETDKLIEQFKQLTEEEQQEIKNNYPMEIEDLYTLPHNKTYKKNK